MLRQQFLPGFPEGSTRIGDALSIVKKDGCVSYFVGGDNYFSHSEADTPSRRFALASLIENSHVRARDLEGAPLCIPHRTLMNWTAQLRQEGPSSFFHPAHRRSARVMTAQTIAQCSQLLAEGISTSSVAKRVGINESTLRKAIGRKAVSMMAQGDGKSHDIEGGSTKAERSRADAEAASGMGTACTRADERVAAAMVLPAVQIRLNLAMKSARLHGSKRQTAALTAMRKRIAPPPRQWFASPGCIRPQPAIDPATGLNYVATAKHFLFPKNAHRQICADFDRH